MASVDVWVSNQITLRFNWSQSSQSITNNNSVVSWNLQLISSGGSISSSASKSWNVTVNGSNYSGTNTVGVGTNATKTLASGSTTIGHNADGSKTFSFSFSQQFDISYSGVGWIGTKYGSGDGTLSTIPRTSSVSASNANIGEAISISIHRASSSFTHTVTYAFCNLSGTIATKTSSTSLSYTLPTSFYAQIPNDKASWGRIICDTYNGNTKIGSSECRFDVYVKESTNKPTMSPTVKDTNATTKALTGNENAIVNHHSNVAFNFNASAKNSATIKTYNLTAGGQTSTSSSGTLSNVNTDKFISSVADSRGFVTTQTISPTFVNYIRLTCTMDVGNPTADGKCTLKITGNVFNNTFGESWNSLTVQYRTNNGDWTAVTADVNGYNYTATVNLTGLDYTQAYTFQARAIDSLETATTNSKTVKSTPIFDWGANDFDFHVPVFVKSDTLNNYIGFGVGTYDVYIRNDKSDSYLQMKDNGELRYNNALIYTESNLPKSSTTRIANGTWLMNGAQTVNLQKNILDCQHGICLEWQDWGTDSILRYKDFVYTFIPRAHAANNNGKPLSILIPIYEHGSSCITKYVYVHNDKLVGYNGNAQDAADRMVVLTGVYEV